MIDKTKIINKFKKLKHIEAMLKLEDEGVVVGTEIDENNRLHYVIQKGTDFFVEKAEGQHVKEMIFKNDTSTVFVKNALAPVEELEK